MELAQPKTASQKLRVLDLFSGIGGFSLGLERTGGFETVAFCEIEEFPRRVLAKHWPGVPIFGDIRELTHREVEAVSLVDVICGGFPCQDISYAGRGAGIHGERSGLWREYARLIGELQPLYVIVENVPALLRRGIEVVLGDLAALGYDAEWRRISAADVGAQHLRQRIWIVAYPNGQRLRGAGRADASGSSRETGREVRQQRVRIDAEPSRQDLADAHGQGLEGRVFNRLGAGEWPAGQSGRSVAGQWISEPNVGRVAHGVPSRVDRLRGLGNAVVPQIPEIVGYAILEAHWQVAEAA